LQQFGFEGYNKPGCFPAVASIYFDESIYRPLIRGRFAIFKNTLGRQLAVGKKIGDTTFDPWIDDGIIPN
jgi:hypothetical protein